MATGAGKPRSYLKRGLAVLVLAVAVIAVTDWLAATASNRVATFNPHWWGGAQESPWTKAAATGRITFLKRDLTIKVDGDQMTAVYEVTVPNNSPVVSTAESDTDSEAGDDLVASVLGQVEVGEFHYGITGHELSAGPLTFQTPRMRITKDPKTKRVTVTLDVTSDSVRLYEHRQQIIVLPPNALATSRPHIGGPRTAIDLTAPAVQVTSPTGISVGAISGGGANLLVKAAAAKNAQPASFMLSEGDTSPSWFDGLRAVGAVTLPIADAFLSRMSVLFTYVLFLWAFRRTRRVFPDNRLVVVGFQAIQTVIVALAAEAVLGLAFDLSAKLEGGNARDYLFAGPLGLLIGAAVTVWPLSCWRAGEPDDRIARRLSRGSARQPVRWRRALVLVLIHLAIVALFWARLAHLRVSPLTSVPLIAGTAACAAVVPLLVRLLLGRGGLLTWLSSAGLLGAVLAAATSWPLLIYGNYFAWYFPARLPPDANPWGKWAYVGVAVVVAAGLCVLWTRVALTAARRHWSWIVPAITATVVVAIILAAILPDAVSESGVGDPQASGLEPSQLFTLFDDTPALLSWLFLVLAIVVVMTLPRQPDPRAAARDLALPIGLLLLYWLDTWLYLPVTAIAGIFLIRWLMMPRTLTKAVPSGSDAETLAREAAAGWRHADFIAGQQQALAANSADALRDALLTGKNRTFERHLGRLAKAQDDLATELTAYRQAARTALTGAFSHFGVAPDPGAAAVGAVTGAIVGIMPATITMLTTAPPSADGSYPILNFFDTTAWNLLAWAGLGWFIGYFLPLIRGDSGTAKALWIFIVGAAASLPSSLIWNDAQNWAFTVVDDLEFLIFLVVTTVIVCDLRTLHRAGLRVTDWPGVHNWRFVATWSAALVAAVGTLVITFATTTVTDLSQQLTQPPSSSQPAGPAPQPSHT